MSEPWTPGPWRVDPECLTFGAKGVLFVEHGWPQDDPSGNGNIVVSVGQPHTGNGGRGRDPEIYPELQGQKVANARLIAAAPEMAEALAAFNLKEEMIVGGTADALVLRVPLAIIQQAAAALRKARGEP